MTEYFTDHDGQRLCIRNRDDGSLYDVRTVPAGIYKLNNVEGEHVGWNVISSNGRQLGIVGELSTAIKLKSERDSKPLDFTTQENLKKYTTPERIFDMLVVLLQENLSDRLVDGDIEKSSLSRLETAGILVDR